MVRKLGNRCLVWSDEDLSYLRKHFAMEASSDIADHLGVSDTTVRNKARELGLAKSSEFNVLSYHSRYVRSYYGKKGESRYVPQAV